MVTILAWSITATAADPAKPVSPAAEAAAARKQMIGTLPPTRPGAFEDQVNPDGDYIFEATSAQPLVKGGECFIESDKMVKGLTVARSGGTIRRFPDNVTNAGLYWTLNHIRKGRFWLGLMYAGNGAVGGSIPTVYLNGRVVQLATQGNPVQVAPGVWFIEAFAGQAEALEAGDEVAVAFNYGGAAVRLLLHSQAPVTVSEAPWRMPGNFGGHQWNPYTALGVNVEGKFLHKDGKAVANPQYDSIQQDAPSVGSLMDASGKVNFLATLSNPLPIPVTVDYTCVLKTFYGETVARDAERLTIPPHDKIERKVSFTWKEGELTHFADLVLLGVKPPDLSEPRDAGGLAWPKYEVYSYFPGQRHILPWPDSFNTRVVRRITISQPYGGARQTYGLDGNDWEMGYTTELEPPIPVPGDIVFARASVPKAWGWPTLDSIKPRPHGAYFRRTLVLPADIAGRSFKLVVDYVNCEATAYVNGQKTGNVRGEDTPLVCDITQAVKPGTNEIVVVVRDAIAIMDQSYVNRQSPVGNLNYLDAPGIFGGNGLGIGSVEIQSAPVVSSEDVFVSTSVRNKKITAKIAAANRGHSDVTVRVVAEVIDDGKAILKLGEKEISLKPGQPVEVSLETSWKHPQLWEPGHPHLYALRVTLVDAKTGLALDVRRDRFGFRESWIAGPDIMFNGYPIKPVGYSPIIRFSPKGNFIFTRGGGRDWLDEVGILGYKCISGLRNTASQHNVESDTFWKAAEQNNIAALKIQQNSPHILAWDISNEWLCFLDCSVNDPMAGPLRFKHLSDIVRAYDPTRWTLANAEGDFKGLLDNHSFHYMRPYFQASGSEMRGHTEYFPDGAFWRPLDSGFKPGEAIMLSPFHQVALRPDKKVIMDNEYLWKVGGYMPPGPSALANEDDVLSPAVDSASSASAWMWKTLLDGHRDLGVSTINIYSSHAGVVRGGYLEQTFVLPENQHHGFSGSKETRRFTLLNGLFRPCKMTFSWALTGRDGKDIQAGREVRKMISGDIQRGDFSFELPKVSKRTGFTLKAQLESDGQFVCAEEWDIDVWPALGKAGGLAPNTQRKVFLFDPSGRTADTLGKLGVTFAKTEHTGAPAGDPASALLIIGENALDENKAATASALADFVEKGGNVLVLGQKLAPANLPIATRLDPKIWTSQVFVRAGSHPILEGFTSYDLHFWQPNRAVGVGAYTKPDLGNVIVLADSGNWETGLDWVNLMEVFRGRGAYVLCQLPLIAKFAQEPMAMELLSRTVAYAARETGFRRPVGTVEVLTASDSPLAAKLKSAKVMHRIVDAGVVPDKRPAYILDAKSARQLAPAKRAEFAACLRAGAKVVVVNAAPEDQEWLGELAGVPVSIAVQPFSLWDGRGFRKGWSDYTAGLSHLDLYWKRYSGDERASGQAEVSDNIIEPFQEYSIRCGKSRELIFPGALVGIDVGSGLLLIDQRRWTTENESLLSFASRAISSLMTAMDVRIAPRIPPKELPKEVDYKTVDLRPFANRAFADDVAEDGKGGWTDQGPRADLRTFPTGKQSFKGVPFAIGEAPKCCIVLAAGSRPNMDQMPKSVVIPVGFSAEGLFFLQGSAYTGDGIICNYRVEYEDGTFCDIPVKGRETIFDWVGPRPANNEKGTSSVVAWTGSNEVFPLIGVYRMLWVNEKPAVPIKSVVFSTPEMKSVPVLLGLTAAVKKGQFVASPENVARAGKLRDEAKAAFGKAQLDGARQRLKDAIDLDPARPETYQALADVAEKKGDDDWILEAYRAWIYSGPRSPMPYNRVAEMLEKKKDLKGALDNYRESLKVEWNQPPVMDAVRRLESVLKP
jgi:hypothetical protein